MQKFEFAVGLHHEQPVRLAHPAGHLGQKLGAGHTHRDGQANLGQHPCPEPGGDQLRRADQPAQARYVEERLVDRDGLHQGRGVVKDLEHPSAGLGVGVHPRGDDDQLGTQRPGGTDVHRASHTPSAGLVAGGQDHPAPDRHRSTPKFRPVPLLDRGVKRVQVGMKNAGLDSRTHVRQCTQRL